MMLLLSTHTHVYIYTYIFFLIDGSPIPLHRALQEAKQQRHGTHTHKTYIYIYILIEGSPIASI